ncbi:MAG: exosortase/archaeosortase family protein, partial [Desulfobacterales bacterium]|nr:exosortase/archaeosortase family protein [Desulfobacterales bacterium]
MSVLNGKTHLGTKAIAVALVTMFVYAQDLAIVANEAFSSELVSHILAVPFLFVYLAYRKRRMLGATASLESSASAGKALYEIIGAVICLSAFLLYWYGSYTFNPLEFRMLSLPIFTAGLVLIVFNLETLRVLAFPIAFLLFLVPLPLEFIQLAATTLSTASSQTAYTILKASSMPVELSSQYGVPVIMLTGPGTTPVSFAVDIACSDLYELTGFTVFAIFTSYIARGSILRKAAIFIAGFPLIYALNIVRIVGVILLATQSGMETAMQAFHLLGGWTLIFIGTSIFLTISEKILKIQLFTRRSNPPPCT